MKDASGEEYRWERSEWPHPKLLYWQRKDTLLPDVIWLRIHTVFRGGMIEEVTGWQRNKPKETES